jgi:hypothetical protein
MESNLAKMWSQMLWPCSLAFTKTGLCGFVYLDLDSAWILLSIGFWVKVEQSALVAVCDVTGFAISPNVFSYSLLI